MPKKKKLPVRPTWAASEEPLSADNPQMHRASSTVQQPPATSPPGKHRRRNSLDSKTSLIEQQQLAAAPHSRKIGSFEAMVLQARANAGMQSDQDCTAEMDEELDAERMRLQIQTLNFAAAERERQFEQQLTAAKDECEDLRGELQQVRTAWSTRETEMEQQLAKRLQECHQLEAELQGTLLAARAREENLESQLALSLEAATVRIEHAAASSQQQQAESDRLVEQLQVDLAKARGELEKGKSSAPPSSVQTASPTTIQTGQQSNQLLVERTWSKDSMPGSTYFADNMSLDSPNIATLDSPPRDIPDDSAIEQSQSAVQPDSGAGHNDLNDRLKKSHRKDRASELRSMLGASHSPRATLGASLRGSQLLQFRKSSSVTEGIQSPRQGLQLHELKGTPLGTPRQEGRPKGALARLLAADASLADPSSCQSTNSTLSDLQHLQDEADGRLALLNQNGSNVSEAESEIDRLNSVIFDLQLQNQLHTDELRQLRYGSGIEGVEEMVRLKDAEIVSLSMELDRTAQTVQILYAELEMCEAAKNEVDQEAEQLSAALEYEGHKALEDSTQAASELAALRIELDNKEADVAAARDAHRALETELSEQQELLAERETEDDKANAARIEALEQQLAAAQDTAQQAAKQEHRKDWEVVAMQLAQKDAQVEDAGVRVKELEDGIGKMAAAHSLEVQGLMEVSQKAQQELKAVLTETETAFASGTSRIGELDAELVALAGVHTMEIQSLMGAAQQAQQGEHQGKLDQLEVARKGHEQLEQDLEEANTRIGELDDAVEALTKSLEAKQVLLEKTETQKVAEAVAASERVTGLLDTIAALDVKRIEEALHNAESTPAPGPPEAEAALPTEPQPQVADIAQSEPTLGAELEAATAQQAEVKAATAQQAELEAATAKQAELEEAIQESAACNSALTESLRTMKDSEARDNERTRHLAVVLDEAQRRVAELEGVLVEAEATVAALEAQKHQLHEQLLEVRTTLASFWTEHSRQPPTPAEPNVGALEAQLMDSTALVGQLRKELAQLQADTEDGAQTEEAREAGLRELFSALDEGQQEEELESVVAEQVAETADTDVQGLASLFKALSWGDKPDLEQIREGMTSPTARRDASAVSADLHSSRNTWCTVEQLQEFHDSHQGLACLDDSIDQERLTRLYTTVDPTKVDTVQNILARRPSVHARQAMWEELYTMYPGAFTLCDSPLLMNLTNKSELERAFKMVQSAVFYITI